MSGVTRTILVAGGCAAAAGLAFLAFGRTSRGGRTEEAPARIAQHQVAEVPSVAARVEAPSQASAPPEPATSVEQALAAYWGEDWPRIREQMLTSGKSLDLDAPFDFVPWDEAAPLLEKQIRLEEAQRAGLANAMVLWPEELSTRWLVEECPSVRVPAGGLTPEELEAIDEVARPHNEQLRVHGEFWADKIEAHLMDQWTSGRIEKAPYSTYGLSKERGFYATAYAGAGWSVVITLKEEEWPDMLELMDEIRDLRELREADIARYVAENVRR